jgi:hypothetical protein
MATIEVTCCTDCPLQHDDERNGSWCSHTLADGVKVRFDDKLPRKCPLRKQPTELRLKGGAS